jgi:aspartate/methionine/tyrosine aminotransferase
MDILERACALERQGKKVIHLEIGEPDFDTPEPVKEAAIRAIRDGETHYTHSQGLLPLRQAICDHMRRAYGVEVDPERILVTSGTSPAMLLTFSALIHAGDAVLLTDPAYACYPNFITHAGGRIARAKTRPGDGFQFTRAVLGEPLKTGPRAAVVNSPANPTGTLALDEAFEAIRDAGVTIVSDEIYHGLEYDGAKSRSALEFTDNCFVLNGVSKLWAMTGWRLGWVIAPAKYVPAMRKLQQNFFICAGSVAQWAGIAALTECGADVSRMREEYAKRRSALLQGLAKLGLKAPAAPKGALYVLADARHISNDSLALAKDILEKALVGVTPGIDFGPGAQGYLRFSYANSVENIEEGLARLKKYLERA